MRAGLRAAGEGHLDEAILAAATSPFAAVSTVSSEEKTRLAGAQTKGVGGEARTLLVGDATKARGQAGESTVVRTPPPAGRSRAWLAAPLLLLVLVGGAAGFYAYRARQRQVQQSAVPAPQNPQTAQPTPANLASVPISNQPAQEKSTKKEKAAETTSQRAARQKPEETMRSAAPTPAERNLPSRDSEQHQDRGRNPNPMPPSVVPPFDPRNQPGRHPERQPAPGQAPNIRTFPNGSRMIIMPDGTRILTMPNGSTRVFPPGVKPNRKRIP